MASSGRPVEIVIPSGDVTSAGKLKVTAQFTAQGNGSDWGASQTIALFREQAGATVYGGHSGVSNARLPFTIMAVFDVAAGQEVKCGLWGGVSGASAMTLWDMSVVAELVPPP